jgi:energy-coupling factor transporter ATP-binding protein EcfA2
LVIKGRGRADCSNATCPGGRAFSYCGFCKEFSFSLDKSFCVNPDCRMSNIKRTNCPICNKMAVITLRGRTLCINRECPSNRKIVTKCFFCERNGRKEPSFLGSPGAMFCTKGDCLYLLKAIAECFSCKMLAFDVSESRCKNPDCAYHDVEIATCQECKEPSFVVEKEHADFHRCLNPACSLSVRLEKTLEIDAREIRARQLEGIIRDTLSVRVEPPVPGAKPAGASKERSPTVSPEEIFPGESKEGEPAEKVEAREEAEEVEEAPAVGQVASEKSQKPPIVVEEKHKELKKEAVEEGKEEPRRAVEEPAVTRRPPRRFPISEPTDVAPVTGTSAEGEPELEEDLILSDEEIGQRAKREQREKIEQMPEPTDTLEAKAPVFAGVGERAERAEEQPVFRRAVPESMFTSRTAPSMTEVFRFVNEYILKDERGKSFPLYLIIGLSGSGKTTYLTMLGNILNRKSEQYYFPYEGVDVKRVVVENIFEKAYGRGTKGVPQDLLQAVKLRARDLVYDFGQKFHATYIGKMLYAPATMREQFSRDLQGEISTYFLVTELTRHNRTIGKIATIETSGEDFEEIIKGITEYKQAEKSENPLQKVLIEMMDYAEGFVVLVDPANEENDFIYQNLFLVIKESLEPRALNALCSAVRQKLKNYSEEPAAKFETGDLRQKVEMLKHRDEEEQKKRKEVEATKSALLSKLESVKESLEKEGISVVLKEEGDFLSKVEKILCNVSPEIAKIVNEARRKVDERGDDLKAIGNYYAGLIRKCIEHVDRISLFQYELRHREEKQSVLDLKPLIDKAVREIFTELGIPSNFVIDLDETLECSRPVTRFDNLRNIAIVITKSDIHPIIYPPEKYPEKKLPRSKSHLRAVENYLKLCGGCVRYYNASATGYSILRDTLYYPSKENTHTPINVVEPIFEMLGIS